MQNEALVADYLKRCKARLKGIQTLSDEESWSDVVRESQEVVELSLKALLRRFGIEPPHIHDVGDILLAEKSRFPQASHKPLEKMAKISRHLRRDRELAFYGSEDLTPSEFYKQEDADEAQKSAVWVVHEVDSMVSARIA